MQKVYLGRPWRAFAKVFFLNCELGAHIIPEGWSNWIDTSRDKTAFFAEYGSTGPGADYSKRVKWSHNLSKKQEAYYSLKNILATEIINEKSVQDWIQGNY